jgi:hypothetical protein
MVRDVFGENLPVRGECAYRAALIVPHQRRVRRKLAGTW